jgi:diphthamide biosynthesis protein 2
VLYVFGQQKIDLSHCQQEFQALFPDTETPVIVMCDVEYSYTVENLTNELKKTFKNIIPTAIQTESKLQHTLSSGTEQKIHHHDHDHGSGGGCGGHEKRKELGQPCCGKCDRDLEDIDKSDEEESAENQPAKPSTGKEIRELKEEKKRGGRYFELPEGIAIEDCSIFFVGAESLTLTNIMMVHNKCPVKYQLDSVLAMPATDPPFF